MKRLLFIFLFFLCSTISCLAQNPWRFHLAFEDATGAKDTIWIVTDSSGTLYGVEPWLGDTAVAMNLNTFNVWVLNFDFDSTKTYAIGYVDPGFGIYIYAINHVLPITISWDTALFKSPVLPEPVDWCTFQNDYFFGVFNNPNIPNQYDLLFENSAFAPAFSWGSQDQFPLTFALERGKFTGQNELNKNRLLKIYPNPADDEMYIETNDKITEVKIFNLLGKPVFQKYTDKLNTKAYSINIENLDAGMYVVKLSLLNNRTVAKKIIVR